MAMAPTTPMRASVARVVGSAPNDRSTCDSCLRLRKDRPMICTAIKRAARAVIPPKTPSAIERGLIARSTFPSSSCPVALKPGGRPPGAARVISSTSPATWSGRATLIAVSV